MTASMRWAATLAMLTALSTSAVGAEPSTPLGNFPGIPAHPLDSIQEVAAGPAAIRGRVVHERESADVGGITVVLYALPRAGQPGLSGAVTDETGAFAFESIANDPAIVYLLGANYAEIPFGARFSFEAGELERQIELSVADATSDTSGAAVGEVRIEVEKNCESLSVHESHRLDNPGTRAIFIPEAQRNGREPILVVTLPDGASEPQSELGETLERDGNTLSFWGPLRPGQQELEFSYQIPERGPAFEMRRSFPSGARRLVLVERPDGPTLTRSGSDDAELRPGDSPSTSNTHSPSRVIRRCAPLPEHLCSAFRCPKARAISASPREPLRWASPATLPARSRFAARYRRAKPRSRCAFCSRSSATIRCFRR